MNFNEFEQLINSGAEEITLTEDVVLDEGYAQPFEINFDVDNLIIDGNNHEFVSKNHDITFNFNGSGILLKNSSFKTNAVMDFNFNGTLNLENVSFEAYKLFITNNDVLYVKYCRFRSKREYHFDNNETVEFINSDIATLHNNKFARLYNCELNGFENYGESSISDCNMNLKTRFYNENKLIITNSIFEGYKINLGNKGRLEIIDSHFKHLNAYGRFEIIRNDGGFIRLRDTTFEEGYCKHGGIYTWHNQKGYMISNALGHVDAYNCKFINKSKYRKIHGFYNSGSSLILDSCEFNGIDEELIHNVNRIVVNDEIYENGKYYDKEIEYSSKAILKNCKYEDYNKIITDNDNIFIPKNESRPVVKKIKDSNYLADLIHSGNNEIKLNDYFALDYTVSVDVDDLIIDGCGNTIAASKVLRLFEIKADNVVLKNIKFKDADYFREIPGGAIKNREKSLKIINCIFEGNASNTCGGAVINENGAIHIKNTKFNENMAASAGGAIANRRGKIILENCEFFKNITGKYGAAGLDNENGIVEIIDCNFHENRNVYLGESGYFGAGALSNAAGFISIKDSNFLGNSDMFNVLERRFSKNEGHAGENDLRYMIARLIMSNCTVSDNIINNNLLFIENCKFDKYSSVENNFKIFATKGDMYLNDLIEGNSEINYLSNINEVIPRK